MGHAEHLTKERWNAPHSTVKAHDHAVFVYDQPSDLLVSLDSFLHDAVNRGDLATFVHTFQRPEEARAFLSEKIDDIARHEGDRELTLAHHREAFERDGRIDHDHVGSVVAMLKEAAQSRNQEGVRIFVDASREYFDAGRSEEWFAFESWLGPRLQAEVGLVCAYRASDLADPEVLAKVLKTHGYRFGPAAPAGPKRS